MKLLFDENLSFRLVGVLADLYPESAHERDVGLLGAEDPVIWAYAADHGFLLTSKDTDFYDRSVFFGAAPKVLWLRIGNSTVAETADLLRHRWSAGCGNCGGSRASCGADSIQAGRSSPRRSSSWRRVGALGFHASVPPPAPKDPSAVLEVTGYAPRPFPHEPAALAAAAG